MSDFDLSSLKCVDDANINHEEKFPLPEKVHLLSSKEILELVTKHRNQLAMYVTRFHPQKETQATIIELQRELQLLHKDFKLLEDKRAVTQGELEECRILESQYVKQYQDLNQRIQDNYSDSQLKAKLEIQIKNSEEQSSRLELEAKYDPNVDLFVEEFMNIRTAYHIQREKLATWNSKGELKI